MENSDTVPKRNSKFNPWIDFVKRVSPQLSTNNTVHKHCLLSHLYKNEMANLVTLDIHYIANMQERIDTLQKECVKLQLENTYLHNLLAYENT
jgi:hypothetical protein